MIEKILEQFGLSDKEAKIYLTLLEEGKSVVSDIAKNAGINRSTTYVLLETLSERGLINTTEENKVKRYTATAPSSLARTVEEQIDTQKHLLEDLNKILPELESLYKNQETQTEGRPEINLFEGIAGIKSIYTTIAEFEGDFLYSDLMTIKIKLYQNFLSLILIILSKAKDRFRLLFLTRVN